MLEVIWTFSPFHAWNKKLLWSNLEKKKNTRFNESWIKAFLNPILSYRQFTCIAFIWTAVWARSQSSSRWILESIGGSFCYRFITYYGTNFKSKPTCVWLCSLKVAFSILQVMWCLWFHDSLQTREKHIGVLFMRGERRSQKSQLLFPCPDLWPRTEKKKKEQDSRFPQKPKATPQPTRVSMRAEATVDQLMSR